MDNHLHSDPQAWPSTEDARRLWSLLVEKNLHDTVRIFDFVFDCGSAETAELLAAYLRKDGKSPVSVQHTDRHFDLPEFWSVRGHTPAGVPTELFLISLHAWFRDTASRFNCQFRSMGGRAA